MLAARLLCFAVNTWLRFLSLVNAAVWFGSAIFFTFSAGPAFFSAAMKELLGGGYAYYSGAVAQIVIERYFALQQACGLIALVLLVLEKFNSNRPLEIGRAHV